MGYQAIYVPAHWKVLVTWIGTSINSPSCTLESEMDTRIGHQAIDVPAHWTLLGTLERDTNQYVFLHTGKY